MSVTLRHSSTTAQSAHVCHGTTRSHGAHSCQQHRVGRRRRGSDERRRTLLSVRELLDAFQHGVGSVCPRARPAARAYDRIVRFDTCHAIIRGRERDPCGGSLSSRLSSSWARTLHARRSWWSSRRCTRGIARRRASATRRCLRGSRRLLPLCAQRR